MTTRRGYKDKLLLRRSQSASSDYRLVCRLSVAGFFHAAISREESIPDSESVESFEAQLQRWESIQRLGVVDDLNTRAKTRVPRRLFISVSGFLSQHLN